jgi:hypothetical protein|eukprot:SAG11_NODE_1025_length_6147_cov_54.005622_5_plen_88_part_00
MIRASCQAPTYSETATRTSARSATIRSQAEQADFAPTVSAYRHPRWKAQSLDMGPGARRQGSHVCPLHRPLALYEAAPVSVLWMSDS